MKKIIAFILLACSVAYAENEITLGFTLIVDDESYEYTRQVGGLRITWADTNRLVKAGTFAAKSASSQFLSLSGNPGGYLWLRNAVGTSNIVVTANGTGPFITLNEAEGALLRLHSGITNLQCSSTPTTNSSVLEFYYLTP